MGNTIKAWLKTRLRNMLELPTLENNLLTHIDHQTAHLTTNIEDQTANLTTHINNQTADLMATHLAPTPTAAPQEFSYTKESAITGAQKATKPIFIIGCGRSGTTLLFNLLKEHPQLAATDGYPDGEDHVGWVKHGQCLISGLGYPTIEGGHTGYHYCLYMDERDITPDIVANMTAYYYRDVLKQDDTKRVVNKCPHLSNKLRYVQAIFPDAKFVHIIRDCLPVVSSWIKIMADQPHQVLYWPETEFPCFWVLPAPSNGAREVVFENEDRIFPGKGMARFVDYWSTVNQNIPRQLADSLDQLLTIKYEELVDDPVRTLKCICDFCEITPFSDIPVSISKDNNEKYKSYLGKEQIDEFLERSYTTRSHFGYI